MKGFIEITNRKNRKLSIRLDLILAFYVVEPKNDEVCNCGIEIIGRQSDFGCLETYDEIKSLIENTSNNKGQNHE